MSQDSSSADHCGSYGHGVCSVALHFAAKSPLVTFVFGASVAVAALSAYMSTGSPRWKGAPSFFTQDSNGNRHDRQGDASYSGVVTSLCTSTNKPWTTVRRDSVLMNDLGEVGPALRVDVGNLDSPHVSTGSFHQHHDIDHDYDAQSQQMQQQRHRHRLYRTSSSGTSIYDFCFPTASVQAAASLSPGVAGSYRFYRNWSGRFSTNSSVNTPTALISSCASRSGVALMMSGGDANLQSRSDDIRDFNFCGPEQVHLALLPPVEPAIDVTSADTTEQTVRSEGSSVSPRRIYHRSCGVSGCSTQCRVLSNGESFSVSRGYNWSRQLGESENVSGGKLRQTLSHLVGAAAVSCSARMKQSHPCSEEADTCGRRPPPLAVVAHCTAGIKLNHGTSSSSSSSSSPPPAAAAAEAAGQKEEEEACVGGTGGTNDCSNSTGCVAGHQKGNNGPDGPDITGRSPHLEAQLRSLERRLEQQMSGSMGCCATGTPMASCHVESAATTALEKSDDKCHQAVELPHKGGDAAPPAPAQPDRRIDDVFVRHRGDDMASYSLSLTYHDAGGTLRIVNTHTLPPLKLPPRPFIASPGNSLLSCMSGLRLHSSSSPSSQENAQVAECPFIATWNCGVKASDSGSSSSSSSNRHLVAPLPPLESITGPHLEGVTGRRGELRIGAFLGGGWCGKVYECLNTETGEVLAAKQILFDSKDPKLRRKLKQLELELEVLTMAARHRMPWIVGFYGAEKRGHSVLMYLEYCARGSLLDHAMNNGVTPQASLLSEVDLSRKGTGGKQYASKTPLQSDVLQLQQREQRPTCDHHHHHHHHACVSSRDSELDAGRRPVVNGAISSPAGTATALQSSGGDRDHRDGVCQDMQALPVAEVQRITRQMVEALHFLHAHGYAHLDVKTGNILVTENGDARLADFGCSMRLRRDVASPCNSAAVGEGVQTQHANTTQDAAAPVSFEAGESACGAAPPYPVLAEEDDITELRGTALYIAPEMIRFERKRIGTAGDVWSLGCVVMELATGAAPWRHVAKDKLRVLFRIGSSREELPMPPSIVHAAEGARGWLKRHAGTATDADTASCHPCIPVSCPELLSTTVGTAALSALVEDEEDGGALKRSRMEDKHKSAEAAVRSRDGVLLDSRENLEKQQRHMLIVVALEDFVALCLRIRPEDRPSCEELLQHPFLTIT